MSFPTAPHTYISRVVHLVSAGLLIGGTSVPYLYESKPVLTYRYVYMIAAILAFITGLINAHILQPAKMQEKATTWRIVIYGLKIAFFFLHDTSFG